jgi:hypothetical protein
MKRAALGVAAAAAIAASSAQTCIAQTPGAATAAPAAAAPSVYIQEAVLGAAPRGQPNQRATRSCTVTALLRQYCGTAASCDLGSAAAANQQAFFPARRADIAQICNLPLSEATELRVIYRCRYGSAFDGTVIQEGRSIALEDSGAPLGRAAFRIVMACH